MSDQRQTSELWSRDQCNRWLKYYLYKLGEAMRCTNHQLLTLYAKRLRVIRDLQKRVDEEARKP